MSRKKCWEIPENIPQKSLVHEIAEIPQFFPWGIWEEVFEESDK